MIPEESVAGTAAPCDVPIEMASESTPVLVTKSTTSSGLV